MKTELLRQCSLCSSPHLTVLDEECNIAQCGTCGYVFDNPRPTIDELIAFYSKPAKYDSWLTELGGRDRMWKRRLHLLRPTMKPGSLLDVGTGIGQFLSLARPFYKEVYGTEVSTTAIAIAREKYNLEISKGALDELALNEKTFDNITLFHVLEHVPDPKAVLRSCHSLLAPGGIIAVAVPNELASLRTIVKRMLVRLGLRKSVGPGSVGLPRIRLDGSISEVHLSHFTPKVLKRLLEATGFTVVSSTLDPYYVRSGTLSWLKADVYYYFCRALQLLFRVNVFDAMLLVARKSTENSNVSSGRMNTDRCDLSK